MELGENEVEEIIGGVWSTALGMPWERLNGSVRTPEPSLTGVVQITGAWQGAITLRCGCALANSIGAAMFGMEPTEASAEEIRDALGEIVNMIAGNVKARLPAGCQLSLPAVVEGRDYQVAVPGSAVLMQLAMASTDQPFLVAVLERSE